MKFIYGKSVVKFGLLSLIATCFISNISVSAQSGETNVKQPSQNSCKISGSTRDWQNAIMPNLKLKFSNQEFNKVANVDESGNYEIVLPNGIYQVIAEKSFQTLSYKRANLELESCKDEMNLNLFFLPECVSFGCDAGAAFFSILPPKWTHKKSLNIIINHINRKKHKSEIIYKDAILTYNNLTLFAETIIQNLKDKTIFAKGNVWLEDGKKRIYYKNVKLNFKEKEIQIQVKD